jgi:hypothetical protein
MPRRMPDVIQVIVLASHSNTFLRGSSARLFSRALAQKHIFELVHPCIGKQKGRVVKGDNRGRREDSMLSLFEVLKKLASNCLG